MDANQQEQVAQFCGVTGANASAAQTALTSANWNLEDAVALYFAAQEGGSDEDDAEDESAAVASQSAPQASSSNTSGRRTGAPAAGGGIRTLRDLQASADDDDEEDEDKKKRDLFAGGEKSGLAVQDPARGSGSGRGGRGTDHFQNILSQARNNAPRPGGDDDEGSRDRHRPQRFAFPELPFDQDHERVHAASFCMFATNRSAIVRVPSSPSRASCSRGALS